MKIYIYKNIAAVTFLFAFLAIGASSAFAAPKPNLEVRPWIGSANPTVESPYQYTVQIKNIGNGPATGVKINVSFPLTNTSPNKFILGKLSALNPGCSVIANKLQCTLTPGTINPNDTRQITFNFEFQVATIAPTLTANVTTTSTNELNPLNNTLSFTPTLAYVNNPLTFGDVMVTSCTGRGLTSFYECEISPGSTQSFLMTLNADTTVSIPNYAGYTGFWDQTSLPQDQTLHFTLTDGGNSNAEFNGFAVSSTCFEGITTFPGNTSGYNAAYKVCEQ